MTLQDDLAACVGCGLCLPHCPTFRVTGEEGLSPRGRINAIREFYDESEGTTHGARVLLDSCVQCLGCESACPSGVRYGRIIATVNRRDEEMGRRPPLLLNILLRAVERPRILSIVARLGLTLNCVPILRDFVPRRLRFRGISWSQGPRTRRPRVETDVWLFTGCIMDVWFRRVHRATEALIESVGFVIGSSMIPGRCCGALHMHAGRESQMRSMADKVMASMPGNSPIVVDAAGCGALLKDYGSILSTVEARNFSSRVVDVHEWILEHRNQLLHSSTLPMTKGVSPALVVQEPCHLRHAQKVSIAEVLEHFVPVRRLDDDDICCGAGGGYSIVQNELSREIRLRKAQSIRRVANGDRFSVVTGNPGCHLHLAAQGFDIRSSVEVIAEALGLDY